LLAAYDGFPPSYAFVGGHLLTCLARPRTDRMVGNHQIGQVASVFQCFSWKQQLSQTEALKHQNT